MDAGLSLLLFLRAELCRSHFPVSGWEDLGPETGRVTQGQQGFKLPIMVWEARDPSGSLKIAAQADGPSKGIRMGRERCTELKEWCRQLPQRVFPAGQNTHESFRPEVDS